MANIFVLQIVFFVLFILLKEEINISCNNNKKLSHKNLINFPVRCNIFFCAYLFVEIYTFSFLETQHTILSSTNYA
jgi:hypothetical protein